MAERRAASPDDYDPARLLTYAALMFVGILIVFVSTIIGVQIWKSGEANTESWAALTGLIGWATSQVSIIFSNRFGTTSQSAKKDDVIAQQTRTVAGLATGTGTGNGQVTPAPVNLETGNTPAAETAAPKGDANENARP